MHNYYVKLWVMIPAYDPKEAEGVVERLMEDQMQKYGIEDYKILDTIPDTKITPEWEEGQDAKDADKVSIINYADYLLEIWRPDSEESPVHTALRPGDKVEAVGGERIYIEAVYKEV